MPSPREQPAGHGCTGGGPELAEHRAADRTVDRADTEDRASDRTVDRAADRTEDRAADRTVDRASDRTEDRAADRTVDRAADRTVDRAADRTVDRAADRTVDRAADSLEDGAVDDTVDNIEDSSVDGAVHGDVDGGPRVPSIPAGQRLSLDLQPHGCARLLRLCAGHPLDVRFLWLSTHEDPQLLEAVLALLPQSLPQLRSLVLRGGLLRDVLGSCLPGHLTSLPAGLGGLAFLAHLDLSFNRLRSLPSTLDILLPCLSTLALGHNRLRSLPPALGALLGLQRLDLSHNLLDTLPATLGDLGHLAELNVASNRLRSLPASLAQSQSLRLLLAPSNLLDTLPAGLTRLPLLTCLDLRDNQLRTLPPDLLDAPFLRLQGNPLDLAPLALPAPPPALAPEMPRLFLTADMDSFSVTPRGCTVTLACGARLCFPEGATASPLSITYRLRPPEPHLAPLGPHDALLSCVLELQPHGVAFRQDVGLWLLFRSPRTTRCREVVVRTLSHGGGWADLDTRLEEETPRRLWAHCQVPHFSCFLVISRPVSDTCLVPPEGTLLCSSGHPGVRATFPPGATEHTRRVHMQVVHLSSRELQVLQSLLAEPEAAASPLLALSQSGGPRAPDFLRPVTVQLPLPPGISGLGLDPAHLHLLHRAPPMTAWEDVTESVGLELSHLYARFRVTHFSWYWLWYSTQACVAGLARRVWDRLRLHRVNLLALQRRRDPEQVLLQCLPRHKVDSAMRRLQPRYRGPEPSDTVEMFEGESFFAAFERGLTVDAERPDCVSGRLCFVFYSHLKNLKEVYVGTALDRRAQAVRGQVSFYRGEVPAEVPEEAAAARQKQDAWIATLPIKLPRLRGPGGPAGGTDISLAPLHLGDAESGFLTHSNLLAVATRLGSEWPTVALHLGIPYGQVQRIRHAFRDDLDGQIRHTLFSWAERQAGQPGAADQLVRALEQSDRRDVAEEVCAVLELGRQKYQEGVRRVGLAPEVPPEPAVPTQD